MRYEPNLAGFVAWQPSTWPPPPASSIWEPEFGRVIGRIFNDAMLVEINGVIGDVLKSNGNLLHRGYPIAIALLCAVDAIASYGYSGGVRHRYTSFLERHFPSEYRPHGEAIYRLHRNAVVHGWHLFEGSITPGDEKVRLEPGGSLSFGLRNFQAALALSVDDFLSRMATDLDLQRNVLTRYRTLQKTARR